MTDLGTMWYVVKGPKQDPAKVLKGPLPKGAARELARHIPSSERIVARNALYLANDILGNDYSVEWSGECDPEPVMDAEVTQYPREDSGGADA